MNDIYFAGRILSAVIGGMFLYCGILLEEDEEKNVNNLLVKWRLKLDAKARQVVGSHSGILANVAVST